ncbi:hypothetical protein C8J57DRAFT_1538457 [Mycena rebaudengoi]|nr:hypothetical protein C8J57DRAFT_1538457 [Mycena rebaudengoi]
MPRHTAPYRALISSTAQPIAPHRAPMRPQAPGIRRDPARPHPPHPNVTPRARHPNPSPCHPPPAAPPSSRRTSRLPPPASRRLLPARQRTRHPRIFAHHAAARLLVRPPPPVRPSSCNIRTPSSRPGFVCVYCPMLSLQRPPSQIRLLVAAHWPPLVRQPVRNIGIHYTHPALPQWPTPLPSLSIQTLPLHTISRRTALATTTPSPTTSTSTSSSVSHPCDGSAYAPSDASFSLTLKLSLRLPRILPLKLVLVPVLQEDEIMLQSQEIVIMACWIPDRNFARRMLLWPYNLLKMCPSSGGSYGRTTRPSSLRGRVIHLGTDSTGRYYDRSFHNVSGPFNTTKFIQDPSSLWRMSLSLHDPRPNSINRSRGKSYAGSGDDEGAYIHGIPHYTLHELFLQLAAAKGNNVTAIFDSCHSEGASRDDLRARFSPPMRPIPASLDVDIFTGRSVDEFIPTGFLHKHMESHVLLAACRSDQLASEEIVEGVTHGRFTANLLRCLQNAVLSETSYLDVVRRMGEWAYQTPQVEGAHKDRTVFSDSYPRTPRLALALTPCKQRGLFQVDIGSTCGAVTGTEFRVFSGGGAIGCLVAQEVEPHHSILKALDRDDSSAEMPENAKVVVSSWKHGLTKIALASGLDSLVYSQISAALTHSRDAHSEPQFVLVTDASAADIELRYALSQNSLTIGALQGLLKEEEVPAPAFPFVPAPPRGHDRRDRALSLFPGQALEHHPNSRNTNTRYAFTVCNTSSYSLFAYLFYFDPNDYSISALYVPASPTMNSPLAASSPAQPPSMLAIGYGRGVPGFKFTIPPGRTADTGFLKLIVSTKYIDLKWILQESPLGKIRPERIVVWREIGSENVWDTLNAVVEVRLG